MDIINNAMLYALNTIHSWVGSYGLAIILVTVGIRLLVWPFNTQQTVSMRKMQELQPKLKALQAKHKEDPAKMQQALMQFYGENKFNPMAGCLPMLIQLPIFIGLFSALNSPEFLVSSGHERFLFINGLYETLHSNTGTPMDGVFNVESEDKFSSATKAELVMKDGTTVSRVIKDKGQVVSVVPYPMIPGQPATFILNFKGLGIEDPLQQEYYKNKLQSVKLLLVNNKSKELESVDFTQNGKNMTSVFKTQKPAADGLNWDVVILILMYGAMTLLYQKLITPKKDASAADPQAEAQAKLMKFLPLMFVVMMFFIPMPAGVLLYLVVTTAMMFIQTAWINYSLDKADKTKSGAMKPSEQVIEINAAK